MLTGNYLQLDTQVGFLTQTTLNEGEPAFCHHCEALIPNDAIVFAYGISPYSPTAENNKIKSFVSHG